MPLARMSARPVNLSQYVGRIRATQKLGEKETLVFGVQKSKLDTIANMSSLVTVAEGIVESIVQIIQGIGSLFSKKRVLLRGRRFTKCFSLFRLPFSFLSGGISLYLGAQDAAAVRIAYREGDRESLKDGSLSLTSNATNLSGSSIGASVSILQIKGVRAGTYALGMASGGLMLAAFAIYTVMESIAIGRSARSIQRMKDALVSKEKGDLLKYQRAMRDLSERVGISRVEEVLLQAKSKDFSYGDLFIKEADKLLKSKEKRLERRVGKVMTQIIKEESFNILQGLESSDFKKRTLALLAADQLLKKYKLSLYKSLASRVLGCTAGVIGTIGGIVAIANPVGAAIASGLLVGLSSGLILYAYYGASHWKDNKFKNGLKFFNYTVSNFELPHIRTVVDREIVNANKSKKCSPRDILAVMHKNKQLRACC